MSYVLIGLMVVVVVYFLRNTFFKNTNKKVKVNGYETLDDKFNASKREKEEELNLLLEKVSKKGLNNLSHKDRSRLEELSK